MAGNVMGMQQVLARLHTVAADIRDKVMVRVVASAANSVRKEAQTIAKRKNIRRTGALINNIVLKREHDVDAGIIQYNVGVRHGLGGRGNGKKIISARKKGRGVTVKYQNDPYYWFWIEAGHRVIGKNTGSNNLSIKERRALHTSFVGPSKSKTFVGAKPFLLPALENRRSNLPAFMQNRLNEEIAKL
jgi:hypothetical protein